MAVGRGSIKRVVNASNESRKDSSVEIGNVTQNIASMENKQNNRMFSLAETSQSIHPLHGRGASCFVEVNLSGIKSVPVSWIKKFTIKKDISKLVQSIEKYGLLEPLLVRQTGNGVYQLLSGYARLKAISLLRFKAVVVKNVGFIDNALAKEIYVELHKNPYQIPDIESTNIHEQKFQVVSSIKSELPTYLL